ncbi:MAG: hypothetical protein KDA84_08650, partial [Planctomycetaceae bacterium]|nr:hypothetical protein [Planctomycetaceae bacterium]
MLISSRGWCVVGGFAALVFGVASLVFSPGMAAQSGAGALTEESLGSTLNAIGLQTKKDRQRYDFSFKADYEGQQWEFTMSAVLSQNGESLWVMAWLDELPKSADQVPKAALLRLLANNDRLGKGKFFAYVHENRRFVIQRVLDNKDLDAD